MKRSTVREQEILLAATISKTDNVWQLNSYSVRWSMTLESKESHEPFESKRWINLKSPASSAT